MYELINLTNQTNLSLNLNLSNQYIINSCSIGISDVIGICSNWQNYSTYAHDFYIIFVAIYMFCSNLRNFWNPEITFSVKFLSKEKETYTNNILNDIMDICVMVIMFRVIQVWYVINFML